MIYFKIISIHSVFGCSEEQLTIRHLNWAYCSPYPQAAMDGLLLFEEALTVLVFHELYRCVCSPKKRTYKWHRLLCKATPLSMLSGTLAAGFTALSFKTDGSLWYDAPNVIWSVIAALFLLFFSLKMVLSLVKGLKFRNKLGSRDFFLFGLITITIVSQLTKVALKTAKFIVEYRAYDDHSRCLEGGAWWLSGSALAFYSEGRGFDPAGWHVLSRPGIQGAALCPAWHGSRSLWRVPRPR